MKRHVLMLVSGFLLLASPNSRAIVDTDGNGLSDLWERLYNNGELFTPPLDPNADPDHDGWTNAQEAAAGTNPFKPNPPDGILRPDIVQIPAVWGTDTNGDPVLITPNALKVSWPTIAGKKYTLLYSPDLDAAGWLPVGEAFVGTGNITEFNFPLASATKIFWRVQIEDIDSDGDGLTDAEEAALGSNPHLADTDGDGMEDGVEYAAGFNITDPDENHNGLADGYEDFDDDGYINREEALCCTKAMDASSRPDGTAASMIGLNGTQAPVLLVRNYRFDFQSMRDATFYKQGYKGFLSGSAGTSPEEQSEANFRPHYYLKKSLIEKVNERHHLVYSDEDLTVDESSTLNGGLTTLDRKQKNNGSYTQETSSSGNLDWNWTHTQTEPDYEPATFSDEFHYVFPSEPLNSWFCELGNAEEKILSDTESKTVFSYPYDITDEPWHSDGFYENSRSISHSDEYTDSMLITDLVEKLTAEPWRTPGTSDTLEALYRWDYPQDEDLLDAGIPLTHESATFKDVKYRIVSNITGGIPATTRVKFIWKEVSVPQQDEGGEQKVTWYDEDGTYIGSGSDAGQFATLTRELTHPDQPATITPDYNRSGINAPDVLAALNPGETSLASLAFTGSQGNAGTDLTVQRGKPIVFRADLADQNNSPMLTATNPSALMLWELGDDGLWIPHPLPFPIPAEQAAGYSSDPGTYVIQGITPGDVTLQLTANGEVRDESLIHIRRVDLDVDSDNTGSVDLSASEELIEDDNSRPCKILRGGDAMQLDENGIPVHPEKLTSLKLRTDNLPEYGSITISYPSEALRVWKTPPNTTPAPTDLIVSGQAYSQADLGITPGGVVEFSVQAVSNGFSMARIVISCGGADDAVLVRTPFKITDNTPATGVDDVSCTAKSTDTGYQPDTWIMAPSGNVVDTTIPCRNDAAMWINPLFDTKLQVAAPAAGQFTATPDTVPMTGGALSFEGWPLIGWHGNSAESTDVTPVWSVTSLNGSPTPIELPVKVKVMKNRTVKVQMIRVHRTGSGARAYPMSLDWSKIEEELNKIYGSQINAWFKLTFDGMDCNHQYLSDDFVARDFRSNTLDNTGYYQLLDKPGVALQNGYDIRVLLIDDINFLDRSPASINGHTPLLGAPNTSVVAVRFHGDATREIKDTVRNIDEISQTVTHEIGHILLGEGHPDQGSGIAPLQCLGLEEHKKRLMCSGDNKIVGVSRLLVKDEWDKAEEWLSERPRGDD